jgi:hypothetical protein
VRVVNPSDAAVTLRGYTTLIDHVTFILRDPEGAAVSSFCYATVRSPRSYEAPPPFVFRPGDEQADTLYLTVAADHGFRPLRPGRYTIQAVFTGATDDEGEIVARSDALPVLVGGPP